MITTKEVKIRYCDFCTHEIKGPFMTIEGKVWFRSASTDIEVYPKGESIPSDTSNVKGPKDICETCLRTIMAQANFPAYEGILHLDYYKTFPFYVPPKPNEKVGWEAARYRHQ